MPTARPFPRLAIAATLALLLAPASAFCFTVGAVNYEFLDGSDTEVVVSGLANSSTTDITIPSTVPYDSHTYRVTSIGNSAFWGRSGLTYVDIPDSITSIGDYAFYECIGLTSVSIPDSVTSIGDRAFSGCSGLTSILVAAGNACYSSRNGLLLNKDGTILLIGVNGEVSIPDCVTSIGFTSFFHCRDLTSVSIPNSVTNIGAQAFEGCSGLTNVAMPDSVTSIGNSAFRSCIGLANVSIPDSVTSIETTAFDGCASALYDTNSIPGVRLVDGWAVGNQSPSGDLDLTEIRGIGDNAFAYCRSLTSVTIGNSATSIGLWAFFDCNGLTSVAIPDSVMNIEIGAFARCSGLTNVTIPDSVTIIGEGVFWGCSGLKTLSVPGAWEGTDMLANAGVPSGCVVVYRNSDTFPPAQNEAEVAAALAGAADGRLGERIQSVTEYDEFRAWMTTNGLDAGAVMGSTNAWISYAMGAEGLFENEPAIVLGGVSVANPETKGEGHGVALEMTVTVRDGGNTVSVDADKVADLFEVTSDPCDWTEKTRADATPTGNENSTMKFKVQPPGEMAQKAFLRIAP